MNTQTGCPTSLRRSLQLDGIASGLCGVMLAFAAQPISALVGLPTPGIARAVGALLLVYAGALLWNARRASLSRGEALLAGVLNTGWVAGSLAAIMVGPLTLVGNWAVAAVVAAVLVFAVLEVVGVSPPA